MTSRSSRGFSLVELAIVIVILGILFTIASAMFTRARMNGNEAATLGGLRTINQGQFSYLNSCGGGFYATSLTILGEKTETQQQGWISDELGSSATPIWNGYRFGMAMGAGAIASQADCRLRPTMTGYYVSAVPLAFGNTGTRSFGTSQHGTIWQVTADTAPTEPFGPPAIRAE